MDRPNLLLIITDHHAWRQHTAPGRPPLPLPVLDRFRSQGVFFDRAYSVAPVCTPARASLMTGLYPSAHGLRWNTEQRRNPENLVDFPPDQLLYSHYLRNAGYRNAYVGKWHCGHERLPQDFGMEGWSLPGYGQVYTSDAYCEYARGLGLDAPRAFIEHSFVRPDYVGKTIPLVIDKPWQYMDTVGVLDGPPEAHQEYFVSHLACEKLRELCTGNQPWSLVTSFWGPHHAYFPSRPFADSIDPSSIPEYPSFNDPLTDKPLRYWLHRDKVYFAPRKVWTDWPTWQHIIARAFEQQLQLDAAIGRILDTLDRLDRSHNTLVVIVADHGDTLASHGGVWDKASTYTEEVARVPMMMRWSGVLPTGTRPTGPALNMDATATMLDAAGVTVPESWHARSLLGVARDPEHAPRPEHVIAEHNGHHDTIVQRIVVTERHKYVAALSGGHELYDLLNDPYEMHNLIDSPSHTDIQEDLRARLIRHIRDTDDKVASRFLLYALEHGFR